MARSLFLLTLIAGVLQASIWPGEFAGLQKKTSQALAPAAADRAIWDEYGFQEAESATYASGRRKLEVEAWRFDDATGAWAAFEWLRPEGAKESKAFDLAVESPAGLLVASGNYLLRFQGVKPAAADVRSLAAALPAYRQAPLPGVMAYLPKRARVPGSERYVTGPATLERFLPGVPVSAAGFGLSAEAHAAQYRSGGESATMALFNYPTPEIARMQTAEFQKIGGMTVKRSGPLVAVVVPGSGAALAADVLGQLEYTGSITLNERVPTQRDNVGDLIVNVFLLAGILLVICLGGGVLVGGARALSNRGGRESITVLHLEERPLSPDSGRA